MSSTKPSAQDEAQFMELLLSGIDASIFDGAPSPDPTPKKRKTGTARTNATPVKRENHAQPEKRTAEKENIFREEDIAALLEGAEDWDWDDILTPPRKKPKVCLVSLALSV